MLMQFFGKILDFFQMPMDVFGFSFSFWDIILFSILAALAIRIIGGIING